MNNVEEVEKTEGEQLLGLDTMASMEKEQPGEEYQLDMPVERKNRGRQSTKAIVEVKRNAFAIDKYIVEVDVAQAGTIDVSKSFNIVKEQQYQEMMLAFLNARHHTLLQVYEGTDGRENLEISSYPESSNGQLVQQQENNNAGCECTTTIDALQKIRSNQYS